MPVNIVKCLSDQPNRRLTVFGRIQTYYNVGSVHRAATVQRELLRVRSHSHTDASAALLSQFDAFTDPN